MTCPSLLGAVSARIAGRRGRGEERNGAFKFLFLTPSSVFHLCVDYSPPGWITTIHARSQSRRMQRSGCLAAGGWPTWRSQPPLPSRRAAAAAAAAAARLVLFGALKINVNPTDRANQTNKTEPCFQGSACSAPAWPPGWSSRCWRMRASPSKRCGAEPRRRRRS